MDPNIAWGGLAFVTAAYTLFLVMLITGIGA